MICRKFDIGCSLHQSLNQYLNLLKYHLHCKNLSALAAGQICVTDFDKP